jgi:hypothetical protein
LTVKRRSYLAGEQVCDNNGTGSSIRPDDEEITLSTANLTDERVQSALRSSIQALHRVAEYRLSPALDQRMLSLGERKEYLAQEEHDELLALASFAQQRTLEKLEAQVALSRLQEVFPDLVDKP